ncbi:MAG: hypothetical protein V4719_27260 [Planctomycetota bacterium]
MLDTRELATVLAALLFWREEICPSPHETARPYLKLVGMAGIDPLNSGEIKRLSARLRRLYDSQ